VDSCKKGRREGARLRSRRVSSTKSRVRFRRPSRFFPFASSLPSFFPSKNHLLQSCPLLEPSSPSTKTSFEKSSLTSSSTLLELQTERPFFKPPPSSTTLASLFSTESSTLQKSHQPLNPRSLGRHCLVMGVFWGKGRAGAWMLRALFERSGWGVCPSCIPVSISLPLRAS